MNYDLIINQHNIKPHLDIERDMQNQKEGLFTFVLRVSQGNIEDYAKHKTITIAEYRSVTFTQTTIQESYTSLNPGTPGEGNAIRPGNR
jgi:hypothetical protein